MGTTSSPVRIAGRALLAAALVAAAALSTPAVAFAAVGATPTDIAYATKGGDNGKGGPAPTPSPDGGTSTTGGNGHGGGNGKSKATPDPTPAPTPEPTPAPITVSAPAPTPTPTSNTATQTGACKVTSVVIDANSRQAILLPGERIGYTVRWQTGGKCSGATVTWSTDQPGGSFSGSTTRDASATTTFTAGNALGSNWRITALVALKPGNDSKSDSRYVDVKLASNISSLPAVGRAGTTASLSATLTSGATPLSGRTISFAALGATLTAATDATGTATASVDLATATPGSYTFTATFAGDPQYRGSTASAALLVMPADTTPPTVTGLASGTRGSNDWFVGEVLVGWTVADLESAVTKSGCEAANVTTDTASATFRCTAVSLGGATTVTLTVARDATAPTIAASRTAANGNGWNNADVVVTFDCADALSGVASCSAPISLSGEGPGQSATGTASDRAGNAASLIVRDINIDRTAPTITGGRTAPNASGWNNAAVTVTFTCADAVSGIAACTAPLTLGAEGTGQSASGTARDRADNTATTTVAGIDIDLTPPTIAASRTGANANGWNNGDVTVTFTCADALSGIASCSAPIVLSAEGAGQSASGTAQDRAGNTATALASGINIDRTAPAIVGTRTAPNANGWNNGDVVVTFACADARSGVESCGASAIVAGEGAGQSVTRTATDRAGNEATATVTGINVDRTAPAITFIGNAGAYGVDAMVLITCSASDGLSGIASTTCPGVLIAPAYSFATATSTTVTRDASATDRAGNTAAATTAFTVYVAYGGLCELTKAFASDAATGTSLCAQLSAAAAADARGSESAKWSAIAAYQKQVQAEVGHAFTSAQAATLIALSNLL